MKKKWISTLLTTVLLISLLAGCGSSDNSTDTGSKSQENTAAESSTDTGGSTNDSGSSETAEVTGEIKTGGILRIGTGQNPAVVGYTPEMTNNSYIQYMRCAYDSLLYYTEDGSLTGHLATEWSADPENAILYFTLREGVNFSDGTPFNAEAAKWNIEKYKETGRSEVTYVDTVTCSGEYSLEIKLTSWNSSALECIGFFVCYMSPTAFEKNGIEWMRSNSCGTGPYTVSAFEQGVSVKYEKNENYYIEGQPYLDGIEYTIMSDSTTLQNALIAGEIDVITYGNDADLMRDFSQMSGYVIQANHNGIGVESTGLIPSSDDEDDPFYDARVRQAFCYAVDWDTIVNSLSYGLYQRTNQWAAPGSVTYNTDLKGYAYDPDKATQLLADAGYEDGFDTILYAYSGASENWATAVADYLNKVGIRTAVEIIDGAKGNDMMTNGWDGIYWHFASIGPDLGLYMGRHLDPEGAYYAKGIQHPEDTLELLNAIRSAKDADEKIDLQWQLQEKIYDEYALFGMPMYVNPVCHIKSDYVMDDDFALVHAACWSPNTVWLNK